MDTIQKQMQTAPSSGKKFPFKFGGKKKVPEQSKNEHLQEQLRELSVKLEEIDKDLSTHVKTNVEVLDMNQNKRQVSKYSVDDDLRTSHEFYPDANGDLNKSGALNIKASVQKLKTKTFAKGAKSKNRKSNGSEQQLLNGHINSSDSSNPSAYELTLDLTRSRLHDDDADEDSERGTESHRSDSFTDLTKNKSPTSSVDDNVFTDYDVASPRRSWKRNAVSNPCTPRKEIDPNVLAEIDVSSIIFYNKL